MTAIVCLPVREEYTYAVSTLKDEKHGGKDNESDSTTHAPTLRVPVHQCQMEIVLNLR